MFSAVTEDSEKGSSSVCKEAGPEVVQIHDVCESSPESEPAGLDHCGEERDSADCVREPEPTAPADASQRSVGSEFVISKQDACLHKLCTSFFPQSLPMTSRGRIHTTAG